MRVVAFIALALLPSIAAAQQPGPFYIVGGLIVPYQEGLTGEEITTYNSASGGWTIGMSAGAGVFITPRVGIEGEWARTGEMTSTQPSRYDMTFHDKRRDQFLAVTARFALSSGTVRVEPVAVVPSFRFSDTGVTSGKYDADFSSERDIGAIYPGGYPHWTYRAGVGLRINF